jgi:hypothetical protein
LAPLSEQYRACLDYEWRLAECFRVSISGATKVLILITHE